MPSIRDNVSLGRFNTLAVESIAEHCCRLEDSADLPALLEHARDSGWPLRVLGGGSNVLLAECLPGLVIMQACRGVERLEEDDDSVTLSVAAGENWHEFLLWCLQQNYHGLENLALIPGTVGAAPIQNIGAYGVEVAGFIQSVQARRLSDAEPLSLTAEDCDFGYRDSIFKRELQDQLIIESVVLRLSKRFEPQLDYPSLAQWLEASEVASPDAQALFDAVVAVRQARLPDPAEVPNAGSFFKNPQVDATVLQALLERFPQLPHFNDASRPGGYKLAAAWLIDQCGFKQRHGQVRVHPDHALVIINPGRASAASIRAFAAEIVAEVEGRFGLRLEQEPRYCD